jgi:hypothetical protein
MARSYAWPTVAPLPERSRLAAMTIGLVSAASAPFVHAAVNMSSTVDATPMAGLHRNFGLLVDSPQSTMRP